MDHAMRQTGTFFPAAPPIPPSEFDPVLTRLITSPPRPLPGVMLRIFLTLFAALFLWTLMGKLDVIAVAHGRLVPQTYLKIVQPTEAGIIREILVEEGQKVHAGEVLMRMDPTLALADLTSLRAEYERKRLTLRRIDAELAGRDFSRRPEDSADMFIEIHAQFTANRDSLQAALAQEEIACERSRQEMQAAIQARDKLTQTLPIYRSQEKAFDKLITKGHTSRLQADEKRLERIEKEHDLQIQEHTIKREQANLAQSKQRIEKIRSEHSRRLHSERAETKERIDKLAPEIAKQEHRNSMLELRAPQNGRVKNLATHTTGTVAQPGTILMTLVPDEETLWAEVWLKNHDAGFVHPGHQARLKVAAFPFQKYGMIDGTVEKIAADSEQQEGSQVRSQTTYRTLIRLNRQELKVDDINYRLTSGMQLSADIKLGERSISDYLLSPVRKAWHEAGRER
jgi:hemolysin D